MHGLLPVKVKRRILSLAAVFAVPAVIVSAGLALAPAAQAGSGVPADVAGTGSLSVTIASMNPQVATPGAAVHVSGTITNGTRQTRAGLEVQLITSPTRFTTRDDMDSYLARGVDSGGLVPAGIPFLVSASVAPGATTAWSISFQPGSYGISEFGVYPVTAQLQDLSGDVLSSGQTLLPFWPGQRAAGLLTPLKISWLWPLIDQPHHQVCAALTNNDLAASLNSGGRLSALLTAGASHPGADLTWVIDPALLSDAATMARTYYVDAKPNCTKATKEPASTAAANWLTALRKVTQAQPTVITPYANVDMTALVHQGLTADLARAYTTGDAVADSVLHGTFGPTLAWPPGGITDLSVLTNLATAEHVNTVVLNSSEMPPTAAATVFRPDDAVASLRVAGLPMNVLLSDDTLTGVLKEGDTSSGALPKDTEFAVRQRFLAETAMIAAEAPDSARAIVVAPPDDWSPSETLASDLLSETTTTTAPWLTPAALGRLSSAPDTQRAVPRQPPPASKESPGELSRGYLSGVSSLGARLRVYKSMLYKPSQPYVQSLDQALIATESAAWRGAGTPQGQALAANLSDYLENAESKVKIIRSIPNVPMGGSSGLVPMSIQNGLLLQAIQVRVVASADNSPGRTSQLTIGRFQSLVIVPPLQAVTVRLPVSSAPQGSTVIELSLASADRTPLPFTHTQLTVLSTRYGRAILFLIGAAIGVLVLTSVYRGIRRRLYDDTHLANQKAGPPGSVVTGTSDALHPTEAPDDLADARRWADDT
ncbi:MAG: DUF6049 family protein [Streptosporangiaceae bacterium]